MANNYPKEEIPQKSHRFGLAQWGIILLALIAVGSLVYLVVRAERGEAGTLDTLLITVIGLGASVATSVIIGRWSAQRSAYENLRPFLRSAFRSHGELILGLDRVAKEISEASGKLPDSLPLSATKARVQEQSQRALEGLENWKELLPEGIEELVEKIRKKRAEEEKIHEAISEIQAAPFSLELQKQLEKLIKEQERISETSPFTFELQGGEARRLVLSGAYGEAISAYSRLIRQSPRNYTLYMARARARYLAGDKPGALADLEEVERLRPADPYANRLKDLIINDQPLSLAPPSEEALKYAYTGNTLLAKGDGDSALKLYRNAADSGLIPVYTFQNYAMAYLVKGDLTAARENVEKVNPDIAGPFIQTQHFALLALCTALENTDCSNEIKNLETAISSCASFNLNQSPLRFLEQGLQAKEFYNPSVKEIFDLIKNNPPTTAT